MAEEARLQITLAIERIDDPAVVVFRHGIDGQVATGEVLFQRHVRAGVEGEAAVAAAALALGAGQGVLLAGPWMQEHREIGAHRAEAAFEHVIGAGADHHPVDIGHRPAEQPVANRTANFVYLHEKPP
ncbi:hypothetical protein D3C76_1200320 [compost metagenome]